jgi:hypothetical protein
MKLAVLSDLDVKSGARKGTIVLATEQTLRVDYLHVNGLFEDLLEAAEEYKSDAIYTEGKVPSCESDPIMNVHFYRRISKQ